MKTDAELLAEARAGTPVSHCGRPLPLSGRTEGMTMYAAPGPVEVALAELVERLLARVAALEAEVARLRGA